MVCLLCQISNEAGASPRQNRPLQIEAQYQDKTVIVQVSAEAQSVFASAFIFLFFIMNIYCTEVFLVLADSGIL